MAASKSLLAATLLAGVLLVAPIVAHATVLVHSIAPAPSAGALDAWVFVDYPMSIDCSPPRACYAKSQWIHARVHCLAGFWLPLTRISLDLNGNVVAVAHADAAASFVRPFDDGGVAVMQRLCGGIADWPYEWVRRERHPP